MNLHYVLSSAILLTAVPTSARAETIADFNAILTAASPTELGRPSRNGVQQTWTYAEAEPAIINATTRYAYQTYTFSASLFVGANWIEITAFDTLNRTTATGADFVSAYAGSYNPASPTTGWLGDEGVSGNYFGTDAPYFDVFVPFGQNLTLVVNDTSAAGLNDPIAIDVSGYGDSAYGDAIPTPEPSTLLTFGTGLAGIATVARGKFKKRR